MEYTQEQQVEITERVKKAQDFLKELQLFPSAVVRKVNLGNDVFGDQVISYLADAKYLPKKDDTKTEEPNKVE